MPIYLYFSSTLCYRVGQPLLVDALLFTDYYRVITDYVFDVYNKRVYFLLLIIIIAFLIKMF